MPRRERSPRLATVRLRRMLHRSNVPFSRRSFATKVTAGSFAGHQCGLFVSKSANGISVWPCPARPARPITSPLRAAKSAPRPGAALSCNTTGPATLLLRAARAWVALPIASTRLPWVKAEAARWSTIRPSFITTTRSEVDRISPRICEIRITAPPVATKRRTCARSCAASPESSDEVGSSRITTRGASPPSEKAIAISTIWRSAMDRAPTCAAGSMAWPENTRSRLRRMMSRARARQPMPPR